MEGQEEMKKEIKINNDTLEIEANDDKLTFTLRPLLSFYKMKKEFKLDEIKKALGLEDDKNIKDVYDFL